MRTMGGKTDGKKADQRTSEERRIGRGSKLYRQNPQLAGGDCEGRTKVTKNIVPGFPEVRKETTRGKGEAAV